MIALLDNVSIRKWWLTVYGVTGPCRPMACQPKLASGSIASEGWRARQDSNLRPPA